MSILDYYLALVIIKIILTISFSWHVAVTRIWRDAKKEGWSPMLTWFAFLAMFLILHFFVSIIIFFFAWAILLMERTKYFRVYPKKIIVDWTNQLVRRGY